MMVVVDRLLPCLAARMLCIVGRKKLLHDRYLSAEAVVAYCHFFVWRNREATKKT